MKPSISCVHVHHPEINDPMKGPLSFPALSKISKNSIKFIGNPQRPNFARGALIDPLNLKPATKEGSSRNAQNLGVCSRHLLCSGWFMAFKLAEACDSL